ncbi:MAG: GNAT family N-acetyltransferase [Alphaproteobacteria bacterium]
MIKMECGALEAAGQLLDNLSSPLPAGEICLGPLEVRLAETAAELRAAQKLRYDVFYREMAASPSPEMLQQELDFDRFDEYCDHILVIDHSQPAGDAQVVGTYRLIRQNVANKLGGFYSGAEYDMTILTEYPGKILELGRSCVAPLHRNRPTMQLLWRGIATYIQYYNIDLMFGCASLPGINPQDNGYSLSYLYYHHLAPPAFRATALRERYVDMRIVDRAEINEREAMMGLPPLLKGYLRLGALVGDGAVIDHQFNTTDVCIVLKTDLITDRYARHYDFVATELQEKQPALRELPIVE